MQEKDSPKLNGTYGGVSGLARKLHADLSAGLQPDGNGPTSVETHRRVYGANKYKEVPPKSFFAILYEGFKDPVILLLCAAATVSFYHRGHECLSCSKGLQKAIEVNGWQVV
jgi:Ca2+-transporting ATPase